MRERGRSAPGGIVKKIKRAAGAALNRRRFFDALDKFLVAVGWFPEKIDGTGMVLHISDTPTSCFPFVRRTLMRINPSVVVHTGDVADDIKLELYPGECNNYRACAAKILAILEAPRRRVIVTAGNHDDAAILSSLAVSAEIAGEAVGFEAGGLRFAASHYYSKSAAFADAAYCLYGHNRDVPSGVDEAGRFLLNGICAMNLIDTRTGDVTEIRYPRGTDNARLLQKSRRRA